MDMVNWRCLRIDCKYPYELFWGISPTSHMGWWIDETYPTFARPCYRPPSGVVQVHYNPLKWKWKNTVNKYKCVWIRENQEGTSLHITLQWRHNERDGVSNHQPYDCLLNLLFRRRSTKTSKIRVTGLCAGNSPVTGESPSHKGPVMRKCFHLKRNFDFFFDLQLNKQLSKQSEHR